MGNNSNKGIAERKPKELPGAEQVAALKNRRKTFIEKQGEDVQTVKVDISSPDKHRVHPSAMTPRDRAKSIRLPVESVEKLTSPDGSSPRAKSVSPSKRAGTLTTETSSKAQKLARSKSVVEPS
ncbi:hypothetical protein AKO1_005721 [Acrasis kona]|uniref:Uncharacterized protein n=1 Tax=Acrasis kona TaxID=1008807 RepID=A0AAW2YJT2_9EUKA